MTLPDQSKFDSTHSVSGQLLTHRRLLGARLRLHIRIRFIVSILIMVGTFVSRLPPMNLEIQFAPFLLLATAIVTYNVIAVLTLQFVSPGDPHFFLKKGDASDLQDKQIVERSGLHQSVFDSIYRGSDLHHRIMFATIVLDFLALTVAIWLVGGIRSPFLVFYLLHVIISSVLLSRKAAIACGVFAYLLLVVVALVETTGLMIPSLPLGGVACTEVLDARYAVTELVVYFLLIAVVLFLLLTLTGQIRAHESRIRDAEEKLRELSSLRRDFLHIAAHNLKSPVGAVIMLLTNMKMGIGGSLNERQADWVERSLFRLDGLTGFLNDLQMLSSMESGKITSQSSTVNVTPILGSLVDDYKDLAEERQQVIELVIDRNLPDVLGVERLLREAIVNYITNAIKYSGVGGHIVVRGRLVRRKKGDIIRIEVQDDGEGMTPYEMDRLFGEFVRLERHKKITGDDSIPGTGLGLSLVRRIIEAHRGTVSVESKLGEGSLFIIELPAATPYELTDQNEGESG